MSDQKNLIIAIVVSVAILLGFQFFVEKPKQDRLREQQATQQSQVSPADGTPVPGASGLPQLPNLAQQAADLALTRDKALAETPRVKIEGKRLVGSINLVGARIDDVVLPEYKETIQPDSKPIHLLSPAGAPSRSWWRPPPGGFRCSATRATTASKSPCSKTRRRRSSG